MAAASAGSTQSVTSHKATAHSSVAKVDYGQDIASGQEKGSGEALNVMKGDRAEAAVQYPRPCSDRPWTRAELVKETDNGTTEDNGVRG